VRIYPSLLSWDLMAINGSHPLNIEYWVGFKQNHTEVTILGANIDVSRELLNGKLLDVEYKVKENIMYLAAGGRYALEPIFCLLLGFSLNYIMAMPKAIKKRDLYSHTLN
jgi:hypothetical protein